MKSDYLRKEAEPNIDYISRDEDWKRTSSCQNPEGSQRRKRLPQQLGVMNRRKSDEPQ